MLIDIEKYDAITIVPVAEGFIVIDNKSISNISGEIKITNYKQHMAAFTTLYDALVYMIKLYKSKGHKQSRNWKKTAKGREYHRNYMREYMRRYNRKNKSGT